MSPPDALLRLKVDVAYGSARQRGVKQVTRGLYISLRVVSAGGTGARDLKPRGQSIPRPPRPPPELHFRLDAVGQGRPLYLQR
jgi:hypothetical protein